MLSPRERAEVHQTSHIETIVSIIETCSKCGKMRGASAGIIPAV